MRSIEDNYYIYLYPIGTGTLFKLIYFPSMLNIILFGDAVL